VHNLNSNYTDISMDTDTDTNSNAKKIVLAGNPNVGKSVFFNYLTGVYVDISNYPGTTVDITHGKFNGDYIYDTPGVYGVSSFNDEERVARDIILQGDIVINVVDALHMDRDLFLTRQLIDMGKRVIVALNIMDEVEKNGVKIDIERLSEYLGVPVYPTSAVKREGLENIKDNIDKARKGSINTEIGDMVYKYKDITKFESEALMIAEDDENICSKYNVNPKGFRDKIYTLRRQQVEEIMGKVVKDSDSYENIRSKISNLTMNPITAVPILIASLAFMYYFIGVLVAQHIVDFTEGTVMRGIYEPFIRKTVLGITKGPNILYRFIAGDFGLVTLTPTYVIGLLLPLVIGFYFLMSIMEDSGYLPRVAALVDRALNFIGLNGRAIIPIILGFGCVTMATISTRLLGTRREKIIATALLGLTIPCSAQMGVITGMIAPLGAKYLFIYCFTIFLVFVLAGTGLNAILPGESSGLFIDIPQIRIPSFKNVMKKTYTKSAMFIKEAFPIFALGTFIVSLLQETGALTFIQNGLKPIVTGFLKLPKEAATALVMGVIRRDFGAAGLTGLSLTKEQTLVAVTVITLFVPCIASIIVMFKERSKKEAFSIWFGSLVTSFLVGGAMAAILIR